MNCRKTASIAAWLLLASLTTAQTASAQRLEITETLIRTVFVDVEANTLSIHGRNFGDTEGAAGFTESDGLFHRVTILSWTDTTITAVLLPPPPGNYKVLVQTAPLTLVNRLPDRFAVMAVTIGAVGEPSPTSCIGTQRIQTMTQGGMTNIDTTAKDRPFDCFKTGVLSWVRDDPNAIFLAPEPFVLEGSLTNDASISFTENSGLFPNGIVQRIIIDDLQIGLFGGQLPVTLTIEVSTMTASGPAKAFFDIDTQDIGFIISVNDQSGVIIQYTFNDCIPASYSTQPNQFDQWTQKLGLICEGLIGESIIRQPVEILSIVRPGLGEWLSSGVELTSARLVSIDILDDSGGTVTGPSFNQSFPIRYRFPILDVNPNRQRATEAIVIQYADLTNF